MSIGMSRDYEHDRQGFSETASYSSVRPFAKQENEHAALLFTGTLKLYHNHPNRDFGNPRH